MKKLNIIFEGFCSKLGEVICLGLLTIFLVLFINSFDVSIYYNGSFSELKLSQVTGFTDSNNVPSKMKLIESIIFSNEKGASTLEIIDLDPKNQTPLITDNLNVGESSTWTIDFENDFILQLNKDNPEVNATCDVVVSFRDGIDDNPKVVLSNIQGHLIEIINNGGFYLSGDYDDSIPGGQYSVNGIDKAEFYLKLTDDSHYPIFPLLQTFDDVLFVSADIENTIDFRDIYECKIYNNDIIELSPKKCSGLKIRLVFNEQQDKLQIELDGNQVIKGSRVNEKPGLSLINKFINMTYFLTTS